MRHDFHPRPIRRSQKAEENERLVEEVVARVYSRKYKAGHQTAKVVGANRGTVYNRLGASLLDLHYDEISLVKWIKDITITGYTPTYYKVDNMYVVI